MTFRTLSGTSLFATFVFLMASTARADNAAQARYHDDLARGHYAADHYDLALREFFLEQQLAPNPRILFNIAVCFEALDRDDEAFTFYADYLADPSDTDSGRRTHATAAVARLSSRVARVSVTTNPPGASIYVDRRELGAYGVSPRTVALEPGRHRVWVELDGYHLAEANLTIRGGGQEVFNVQLERIVAPLVVVAREGSTVQVIDDTGAVVATATGRLEASLPPAIYEVRVLATGHRAWSGTVRVLENTGATLDPPLESLPEPTGELTVTANSLGAVVNLDGQVAGFAPVVLTDLSVGRHAIVVHREGMLDWTSEVEIEDGRRTWTTVTLEEPGHITRSPAAYIVGASGIASTLASVIMFGIARARYNDYEDSLTNSAGTSSSPRSLYDTGRRIDIAATSLLAAGIVQVGIGTTLYFTTRREVVRPSTGSSQVSE